MFFFLLFSLDRGPKTESFGWSTSMASNHSSNGICGKEWLREKRATMSDSNGSEEPTVSQFPMFRIRNMIGDNLRSNLRLLNCLRIEQHRQMLVKRYRCVNNVRLGPLWNRFSFEFWWFIWSPDSYGDQQIQIQRSTKLIQSIRIDLTSWKIFTCLAIFS